jgi:MFS family permease
LNQAASDTIRIASAPEALAPPRRSVLLYYVVEGVSTVGVALMLSGIYFYTTRRFGWGSAENFRLAASLGVIYVLGALSAHAIATRLGRRGTLVLTYLVMAACAAAALWLTSPRLLVVILMVYSGVSAITWPALESLVSSDLPPGKLPRRLGVYNCVWSGSGAITFASAGFILKHWTVGIFVVPAVVHAAMALLIQLRGKRRGARDAGGEGVSVSPAEPAEPALVVPHPPGAHDAAEPELLRARTLALWMSRLTLPATFVVISSLLAAMPTLPLIRRLDPTTGTVLASAWMGARWVGFLVLGATAWWHTRPRALLWAAVLLLAAFLAITFQPEWLPGAPAVATGPWVAWLIAWLIAWQVVLGLALGLIYSASLYFGMVLSEGSTEHGGYHEALIGLGTVIGPGAGALAETIGGGSPAWGVAAVAGIIAASVVACGYVAARRSAEHDAGAGAGARPDVLR